MNNMEEVLTKFLADVTQNLRKGCTAHINNNDRRLYYMNHETKTSSWLPPVESWNPGGTGLPYGWELAKDKEGKTYFINHVNKTSTYEDPRKDSDEEPPEPRDVELVRDVQMGFGFVAGSEKPVIVRFVTEGGPSEGKLQPGDQILKINGENVEKAPREHVIELVRSCKHSVKLTVCQPTKSNGARKSALLSAAKKAKLKNNPCRVRFAEGVVINGSPLYSPSPFESCVPFLPNVLKVFLENGQTKSFKYDSTTTVQDVLDSLQEKLSVKCVDHFSLVVEHIKSIRRNKLTLLDTKDTLAKIAARPGAHHLRCLFRVVFVPKDAYDLLQKDPLAFEYLYVQCCNDVVHERFAPELKYDIALRLAALHIQQHALTNGMQGKLNIKTIERECGLDRFVPLSLLETMKRKELRKLLSHFLKLNQGLSAPGQKQLTALQAKLHYLKIISELPSYGAKCFSTNLKDSTMETALLVSPKYGISQINSLRSTMSPMTLAHIEEASSVHVTKDDELSYAVELFLKNPDRESLVFSLEDRDTEEFVLLLRGYHRLLAGRDLPIHWDVSDPWRIESVSPNYHGQHLVQVAPWNYPPKLDESEDESTMQIVDLAMPVPPYVQCDAQLLRSSSRETFSQSTLSLSGSVDHNMNEMQRISHSTPSSPNSGQSSFASDLTTVRQTTPSPNSSPNSNDPNARAQSGNETIDLHSVMSIELLEDAEADDMDVYEAKNRDVIQRVVEMNQIVADAEDYLLDDQDIPIDEDVDGKLHANTESINPVSLEGPTSLRAKLKAADSLLLLTQIDNHTDENVDALVKETKSADPDASPSESDTDSLSTPNDSPLHSARIRDSPQLRTRNRTGSSFGLHSPDLLPGVDCEGQDVMELLKQLQTTKDMQLPFAEGTFYLDPDIIDLTMIPPPITPDSDLPLTNTGTPLDNPPTPFLDQSLMAKKPNQSAATASTTSQASDDNGKDGSRSDTGRVVAELDHLCNALSELQAKSLSTGVDSDLPLTLNSLPPIDDIDSFIASVAVPPPPSSSFEGHHHPSELRRDSDSVDDLSAFIIPPPPSSSPSTEEQNEVIARFRRAAADMKRIMNDVETTNNSPCHNDSGPYSFGSTSSHSYSGSNNHSSNGAPSQSSWLTSHPGNHHSSGNTCNGGPPTGYPSNDPLNKGGGADTLSLASDSDFHGSIGGDSSGYETLTSSLTSYGEMAFPDENEDDESQIPETFHSYSNVEFTDAPKYANVILRGPVATPTTNGSTNGMQSDYEDMVFQFNSPPSLGNNDEHLNGSSDDRPRAPPRVRKSLENGKYQNGDGTNSPVTVEGLNSLGHSDFNNLQVPNMSRSVSWNSESQDDISPTSNKKLKPLLVNGKALKPPLPPASPNADRARKALKAGVLANGRLQTSPSLRRVSNGSSNSSSPELNHSPRGSLNGLCLNGSLNGLSEADDSMNNNLDDSKEDYIEVESSFIIVPSGGDHGDGTVVRTNGCIRSGSLNGVLDRKSKPLNVNDLLASALSNGKLIENHDEPPCLGNGFGDIGNGGGSPQLERKEHFSAVLREIKAMVFHLDVVSQNCLKNGDVDSGQNGIVPPDADKFVTAKEALIAESRQFVTASKLFVKSATESSEKVTDHLTTCVTLLDRIFTISELVLIQMASSTQVNSLVEKLKEVALAYSNTVSAAQQTVGKNVTNPDMCTLMHQATALATALTTLMRTLRSFSML